MKRYDEIVLNKLLDKYERSLLSSGKNQRTQSIAFAVKKETLPEYFSEDNMKYDIIEDQLQGLVDKSFIKLVWDKQKSHILSKCILNVEKLDEIYNFLHRKPKTAKEKEILQVCKTYQGRKVELDNFLLWVQTRLENSESVKKYVDVDAPKDFSKLCELIFRILDNDSECFLRRFSIKWFADSKIAEKEITKATNIITEFSPEENLCRETEEVLEEHYIYKNPSWIMMKGNIVFQKLCGEKKSMVDLQCFPYGIGIPNKDVEGIVWLAEEDVKKVVTIENLTSFHQWVFLEKQGCLSVYLGGYHNAVKRKFLKDLFEVYPDAEYYHFGDIDCGGFRIWKDLCLKTKIPFQILHMDLETYTKYLNFGRTLTAMDKRTLQEMFKDDFYAAQRELFLKMLEENIKLEQECII